MKFLQLNDTVNEMLNKLTRKRKDENNPIRTKKGIVEEMIINRHKEEFKNEK